MTKKRSAKKKSSTNTTNKQLQEQIALLQKQIELLTSLNNLNDEEPDDNEENRKGRIIKARCVPTDPGFHKDQDNTHKPRDRSKTRPPVKIKYTKCSNCNAKIKQIDGLIEDYLCKKCVLKEVGR